MPLGPGEGRLAKSAQSGQVAGEDVDGELDGRDDGDDAERVGVVGRGGRGPVVEDGDAQEGDDDTGAADGE